MKAAPEHHIDHHLEHAGVRTAHVSSGLSMSVGGDSSTSRSIWCAEPLEVEVSPRVVKFYSRARRLAVEFAWPRCVDATRADVVWWGLAPTGQRSLRTDHAASVLTVRSPVADCAT